MTTITLKTPQRGPTHGPIPENSIRLGTGEHAHLEWKHLMADKPQPHTATRFGLSSEVRRWLFDNNIHYVTDVENRAIYIQFKNNTDMTMFVLRWRGAT